MPILGKEERKQRAIKAPQTSGRMTRGAVLINPKTFEPGRRTWECGR